MKERLASTSSEDSGMSIQVSVCRLCRAKQATSRAIRHAVVGTKIPVRTVFNHRTPANNTQTLFPRSLVKKTGKCAGCDAMAWLTCLDGSGWDVARMH
eukprot:scaffold69929_cov41-Attheya_sp.AAC.6